MAGRSVGSLFVNLVAKTDKFEKGLQRARGKLNDFAKSAARYGKLAGVALVGLGVYAVKVAAQFETITVRLKTMLGSMDAAKKMMKDINEFSKRTPYEPAELADATTKLLAFGVEGGNVLTRLQLLGDIASGSGARLQELVSIFGKMKSSGVVALGDLNQLGDRGIPILETLKNQLNLTADGALRKFVSAGKLGFGDVLTALQSMTTAGGIFFGSMEAQSATLEGRFSTLMGNVKLLASSIGEMLLPAVSKIVTEVSNFTASLSGVAKGFDHTPIVNGFLAIGDALQKTIQFFKAAFAQMMATVAESIGGWANMLGLDDQVDYGKIGELKAEAFLAWKKYISGETFSTAYRNANIAKPTEYARTRGMRINTDAASGFRQPVKIPSQNIPQARPSPVLKKKYAGLAVAGTAAGYRASLNRNDPMKEMAATAKKQLTEDKKQTGVLVKIEEKVGSNEPTKPVKIPSL